MLGIDVNITDLKGLTALDTVKDMPSQKSKEIAALILGKKKKKCLNKYLQKKKHLDKLTFNLYD